MDHTDIKGYRSNPQLKTIIHDWKGTPVDKNGRFMNLTHPYIPKLSDLLRWKLQSNPFKQEKKTAHWQPEIQTDHSWINSNEDVIVWLGHCTFYISIGGIRLLTDPVFGDILTLKRQTPFPVDPVIFTNLNYILLSHDHRDHMDKESLQLLSRNNPGVKYLTGLGEEKLVHRFTNSNNIETAGWYQQFNTTAIQITFIPSRHWAKRSAFDTNQRLWGGFVVEGNNKRILFGGDSGYDIHYKQLAEVFGSFDYALLGIGAYQPTWFMNPSHQSPAEALQAFEDLHAKYLIPMHYGTFDLADEPLDMPAKELMKAAAQKNVIILKPGQPLSVN
ncbi:L-ascorbate metabolism protein UlaG, beta-lactamase superfamily [Chitinophaga sp. CF118]|uniref:MBL fold metallo-hydrolase n=1 Tax=Chitinophaga sp. CF118 TaxID=1884367 RepID=UPI0008E2AE9E|nr:MBL fold metallo-hydrolase [Chitinophaga sp. CF118]SFD80285.1 L-ascorbate metabolism protein UlaG, beta-lactamase superfamily [Chitinophaga sp. CF118]